MTDRQSEDEKSVFEQFAEHLPYKKEIQSIARGFPPEPDIICRLSDGTRLSFELVELVDETIAESYYGGSFQGGFSSGDFYLNTIEKKFSKKYSEECELVAYRDLQPPIGEESLLLSVKDFIKERIESSPFSRVWIYSRQQKKVIWVFPDLQDLSMIN